MASFTSLIIGQECSFQNKTLSILRIDLGHEVFVNLCEEGLLLQLLKRYPRLAEKFAQSHVPSNCDNHFDLNKSWDFC